MKRLLSLLLATLMIVLSVPLSALAEDDTASLAAEGLTLTPGKNFFTGANAANDFSAAWMQSWWTGGQMSNYLVTNGQRAIANDGDARGDYVRFSWDAANDGFIYGTHYPANDVAGYAIETDRPVFVGFYGRSSQDGYFLVGGNSESEVDYEFSRHCFFLARDWTYYSSDFTIKDDASVLSNYWVRVGATVQDTAQTVDIDDVIIAPYYRFDYYVDGESYDYAYVAPVDGTNGAYLSSAVASQIDDPSKDGYSFVGWSTTDGSTEVVDTVSLANADVSLYAVFEESESEEPETPDDNYVPTLPSGASVGDPGVNLFGGTATYADFENASHWWHTWWTGSQVNPESIVRTIESGDSEQGKYMHAVWQADNNELGHGYFYHSNGEDLGIENDRPVHASLKARSSDGGFFQFGESGGSTAFDESKHQLGVGSDGWNYIHTSFLENPSYTSFSYFRMIFGVASGSSERWLDIDDLYVAPYYKFTYLVDDEEYDYAYVCPVDEDTGKYIEYASVDNVTVPKKSGYTFTGWSLDGNTLTDTAPLHFEDVTLYAVFTEGGDDDGDEGEDAEDPETPKLPTVPSGSKVGDPGINMYTSDSGFYDFEDSTEGSPDSKVSFGLYGGASSSNVYLDGDNMVTYADIPSGGASHYAYLRSYSFAYDRPITVSFKAKGEGNVNVLNEACDVNLMPTTALTSDWNTYACSVLASEGVIIVHGFNGDAYFDDMYIAADYLFNYYVGGSLYESVYVSPIGDDGEISLTKSACQIDNPTKPGYTFLGWSLTDGGEAVDEITLGCEDVDLYAVWSFEGTLPGVNVLTDDNTTFDFEDGEQGYVSFDGASQYVSDGVLGTEGTGAYYVYMNRSYYNLTGYGRPVAIAFKYKEDFDNNDDFVQIIGNGVWEDTQTYSPTTAWHTAHYLADTTNAANLSDPAFILYAVAGSGQLYFDDFVFAPAYCFTYYVDGEEYTTEYISPLDDDGNYMDSVVPSVEAPEKEGYNFMGWSASPTATEALDEIALNNEDVVLYAVYELDENYYLGEGDPMAFETGNRGAYGRLLLKQNFENISSLNTFLYDDTYEGIENSYVTYPDEDTKAVLTVDTNPVSGLDKSLKLIGKSATPTYRLVFPDGLTGVGEYTLVFYAYRGDEVLNPKVALGVNECEVPSYTNINTSAGDMKENKLSFRVVTEEEFAQSGLSSTDYTEEYITSLNYIDIYLKDGNGKTLYIDNIELWYNEYADITFEDADVETSHISAKPMSRLPAPVTDDGYLFLGWSEEADGEEYTNIAKAGTYTYYPVIKSFDELGLSDMRGYEAIEDLDTDGLSEINEIEYLKNVLPEDSFYDKAIALAKAGIIGADFSPYEYITLYELSAIEERMSNEAARLSYSLIKKEDTQILDSEGTGFEYDFVSAPDSYLATLKDYPETTLELGKWIFPDHNTRLYLRHNFTASKTVEKAEMEFQADNDFDIYINNVLYTTLGDGTINTSGVVDITDSVVQGTNTVGIRIFHTNTPERFNSAIRGAIKLTYTDGTTDYIKTESNGKWKFNLVIGYYANVEPENWQTSSSLATPLYYEYENDLHPSLIKRSVYLRGSFENQKEVKNATLYVVSLGEYVPYVNGERVTDGRFLTGSMSQLSEYQVFNVTDFIKNGENVLAAQLGNGWYNSTGTGNMRWNKNAVLMQLELEYTDGTSKKFGTDDSWLVTAAPLYEDDIMFGERYDARNEIENWNNTGADLGSWNEVEAVSVSDAPDFIRSYYSYVWASKSDSEVLPEFVPSNYPPVYGTEERATKIGTYADTAVYYDFGTNTAGRAKIVLRNTKPGDVILIRYAEDMGEDENMPYNEVYGDVFFVKDTREGGRAYYSARNIDYYICKGAEVEEWIPEFAYTGFRYIYVYGYEGEYTLDTVRRVEMHTGLTEVGDITTSHEGISKIWDAIKRSYKSNIMTGPTDCPTREKNFWNGDIQIFANTACWYMDNEAFLGRWTEAGTKIEYNVYGWEDEEYILPLILYKYYGNTDILESKYPKMLEIIEKREGHVASDGLPTGTEPYGYSPYNDHMSTAKVSADFYAAAFFCRMYRDAAEIASALGYTADAEEFSQKFEDARAKFNEKYYLPDEHDYNQHCQGGVVIPMAFGIADESEMEGLAETLHNYVVEADYHQNSGFTSAEFLYSLLCDYGYGEDALKMLTNETYPSLLYMLSTGATTTTETWNGMYEHSFESANHYAFGNVARWFFEYLGGLNITSPGFDTITIKPYFNSEIGDFKASHESRHGLIESGWAYNEGSDTYTWTVTVPAGVSATLVTPDGNEMSLTNASQSYTIGADGAVTGGLDINIGERQSSSNVRYAEINGIQTKITENADNILTVIPSSDMIVEVVEKISADTPEIVASAYYYVNADEMTYTELSLDSYMTTDGKKSIRTSEPMGIRFKYAALTAAKAEETEFVIDEIGFIVAVTETLGTTELTLDYSKYVKGVAYNKQDGTDIVFDRSDDEVHVFTCVVKNIPADKYKTDLTCKTYTKLTVGGEQFTLYGEAVTGNVYDTAKALLKTAADTETKNALYNIILDYEKALGLPGDGLFE